MELDVNLVLLSAAANHKGVFPLILFADWLPSKVQELSTIITLFFRIDTVSTIPYTHEMIILRIHNAKISLVILSNVT